MQNWCPSEYQSNHQQYKAYDQYQKELLIIQKHWKQQSFGYRHETAEKKFRHLGKR